MSAGIVDIQRQLIKKAKLGDTKAFSQLYAEIYKDLYRFALYMTKLRRMQKMRSVRQ